MTNPKTAVALGSMVASGTLTVAKFAVGLATGSLALISEGAHSLLDLGATILTYAAVRIGDRPPDRVHHYGHGKVESVAALAETGLLFITSAWIVYEAIQRLVSGETHVETTWWSIAVIVGSIVIDFFRTRTLRRVAAATRSQALEADALHFSSDMVSSSVVLVGLGLVSLGYPIADAVAALGVAIFVCIAGYRLGRRTIDTLIDAAPRGVTDRVERIIAGVPGVARLGRVRLRPVGATLFAEIEVMVSRTLPVDQAGAIRRRILDELAHSMPEVEATVATTPLALDNETIHERLILIAARRGLPVHHVTIQKVGERLAVSLDLEVDGRQPIAEAHRTASELERAIQSEFGFDIEVDTHIEPRQVDGASGIDAEFALAHKVESSLAAYAATMGELANVHEVRVRHTDQGLFIYFHCQAAPDHSVEQVHDAVDRLERHIRREFPEARRVVAHAEPFGA
jgi:cation diffusion facilitator family transporter